jgi:hypothetical protein
MYDNVFVSSFGSNLYNTIGFLESMKDKTADTVIWNSVGNASLILFLRILGFPFHQMTQHLKDLNLSHTFINGFSLIPENEEEKKEYIRDWIIRKINQVSLISEDTTLKEIFSLTNLFPNFLVYSRTDREITSLNPSTTPNVNMVDCLLASLVGVGTFHTHKIGEKVYSNLNSIHPFPTDKIFTIKKEVTPLFIGNISFFVEPLEENHYSPMSKNEDEMLESFLERNSYILKNTKQEKDTIIIHSDIFKEVDGIKMENLYKSGFLQGKNLHSGIDTYSSFMEQKTNIYNQD